MNFYDRLHSGKQSLENPVCGKAVNHFTMPPGGRHCVVYTHCYMQNPLHSTVVDAGIVLGLPANLYCRPVAAIEACTGPFFWPGPAGYHFGKIKPSPSWLCPAEDGSRLH